MAILSPRSLDILGRCTLEAAGLPVRRPVTPDERYRFGLAPIDPRRRPDLVQERLHHLPPDEAEEALAALRALAAARA